MNRGQVDVAVIGGGAAGIGAARRLSEAGVDTLLIEARDRLGGRALTATTAGGDAVDLGCGWLHSGDVNPWTAIAEAQGRTVDRSPPPWSRRSLEIGFPRAEQEAFQAANERFHERADHAAAHQPDGPLSDHLEAGGRWNGLIGAVTSYVSGAEPDRVSTHDLAAYADSGVNWRVVGGYGAAIAAHGRDLAVSLSTTVRRIDHSGPRIRIETDKGELAAEAVVVAVPASLIAAETIAFQPALPEKVVAADGLPLGLADKLYMTLDGADEFEIDGRVFGRTDREATGAYHIRPLGLPLIEGYFGGRCASALERGGEAAFFDFASAELDAIFGAGFAKRLKPQPMNLWGLDPLARGSYSFALPGRAGDRRTLAAPVDGRLFFAGEACSQADYSTAHGALRTGIAAAEAILASRGR